MAAGKVETLTVNLPERNEDEAGPIRGPDV
jgi:hypothetical protein